jgi:internalin A
VSFAFLELECLPEELADLTDLEYLDLSECEKLQDLSLLGRLTSLQQLRLSRCFEVRVLPPLAGLTSLRYLDLGWCTQLQALPSLAGLTNLQHLSLTACEQLQTLPPLAGLTNLRHLDLRYCRQLQALPPLSGLTSLQHLDLGECVELQALPPLAGLTSLQHLDLHWCEQLQDLLPLAELTSLQYLNLNCCGQLPDLSLLARSTDLQHLDLGGCGQLPDLSLLAGLTSLRYLGLSGCTQLEDVSLLAGLTSLQQLDLSWCWEVKDLSPLRELQNLEWVRLLECPLDCSPAAQPLDSRKMLRELYADRLIGPPSDLGSRGGQDNALPRIRGWQADLLAGEASNSTVKLFVLGNGRVGKTQICRRLCGEDFDPTLPSTHGISLGRTRLANASGDDPAVDANVWDFGGQDIYLGTHALFLDERAIYVIAWTPQYENTDESEPDHALVRNRPLTYWLEYVRSLAGPLAPVIVVQTQCDRELDVRLPPLPDEHGFERLSTTSSSARQEDGMDGLQVELRKAARFLLQRYGKVRLPASWVAVNDELRARTGEKTLPRDEFDVLCLARHGAAVPEVVLDYLHRSGQVFWRQGLFGNRVVLDLAWALEGIYAVLDRNSSASIIRSQAGRFSPDLLALLVWQNYEEEERKLFLSLMEQCQICFKITNHAFVAPSLLPTQAEMASDIHQIWRDATPDAAALLDYRFLHEGVARGMLCRLGREAGMRAAYWAHGVCFYDASRRSTVRIVSNLPTLSGRKAGGNISIEAVGPGATPLVQHLVQSITLIRIGPSPKVTWECGHPVHDPGTDGRASITEEQAFKSLSPARLPRLPGEPHPVYVSYAWGEESAALVDELERRLPPDLRLKRDKNERRTGDWISSFMTEIGRADLVVVVLSDKYLRSIYCMQEMLHLFDQSLGEREQLMAKLVPLKVGELSISRAKDRSEFVRYWMNGHDVLETELIDRKARGIGEADVKELAMLSSLQRKVSDILAWIADIIMPPESEQTVQRIDAAIELLRRRAARLYSEE